MSDVLVLVEDSEEDVEAVRRALGKSHPALIVEWLPDGVTLLARMTSEAAPRPFLILLDLNLPGFGGHAALTELRNRACDAAVVVFTSSSSSRDVDDAYAAGADGYLVKPVSFELLQQALEHTVTYWLQRGDRRW
ncbi:response regulator [Cryptosporangium japonicum]|uniref:Response regulator n=1 Tax=Cryptosporangium japonicum TaxID=80872 RepID=A0ABN0TJI9_9ACTN